MTKLIDILLYAWQLPQNLLGLLLVTILKPEDVYDFFGSKVYYSHRMRGGIALGRYIVIRSYLLNASSQTEYHELGHSRQSRILGPLYLFVVGIPSILWAAWWNEGRNRSYYSFYTERWADALGGVDRDE